MYVCFEGIDGSGKSTLIHSLATHYEREGKQVLVTKEPGGTALGVNIREVVQYMQTPLDARAEFLLYAADRAQHYTEVIAPALQQDTLVLSDRSFLSSLAYQGYGRGLDVTVLQQVNAWALQSTLPDLFIYLALSHEQACERIYQRTEKLTRFEKEKASFFERVIAGYDTLFKEYTNVIILDASVSPTFLTHTALEALKAYGY